MKITTLERFQRHVYPEPNTGCFLWSAATRNKYGAFYFNKIPSYAHRIAYELHIGPIPPGLHVLHHCDQPLCVNPDHLFLGTHKDNMDDKERKGRGNQRSPFGETNPSAKLTEQQVIEIRSSTLTHAELGRMYGVAPEHISGIRKRKSWKYLDKPREEFPTTSYRHEEKFPELYINQK